MRYESAYYKDPAAYGQDPYGQAPYGQAPYGQAPYRQVPYRQDPYGQVDNMQAGPASYASVPIEPEEDQSSGVSLCLIAMGLCATVMLLIGISGTTLAFLETYEDDSSEPEEVDFPERGGSSSDSSPPDPVPIPMPPAKSRVPAPVVTKTSPAVTTMGSTAPTMRPTAPTAPPAEPPIVPTVRPQAPTVRPQAPTVRPQAPTVRPQAPAVRPQAPTIRSTASTETPDTTTDTPYTTTETLPDTTTEPPGTPPIPEEAIDKQPVLCTMTDTNIITPAFPPDALCDFLFFDSLYKEGHNLLPDKATYSTDLLFFLYDHRSYRRTTLGVGFAFDHLATAENALKVQNPSPLARFWKQGVFHVGILDTPATAVRNQTKAAIATLKAMNQLLDTQRAQGNFSITALAMPQPDLGWSLAFAADCRDLGFTPYLIIAFGHYRFGDNTVPHCAVMPPTRHPDDTPPDDIARDYNFDLSSAVSSLRELFSLGAHTRGLVSVTMKGRWTEPLVPNLVDFFFARCSSDPNIESFGSYIQVCPGGTSGAGARLNYSEKHYAVITYIESKNRAFVYDNEKAFAAKLCHAKAIDPNVSFGIAVYDIGYDDSDNMCTSVNRYHRNSRLKAVKMVVDSFRRQNAVFKEDVCVRSVAP
ncbi:uncharacterized protein [Dermacentor albipictus]|uniref:uncharacterized protein n=1 Tax=Dermacentor albipictus TaxID=60249 RepID=UPI0038FC53DC